MKSSSFNTISILVIIFGGLGGLALCLASISLGIALCVSVFALFLTLQFFASVVDNLEKIRHLNETLLTKFCPDWRTQGPVPQIELTIPMTPAKNEKERGYVLDQIKSSGFKSTQKYKYGDYLLAIDEKDKRWVVVTPNGEGVKVRSFDEFQNCRVYLDEADGYCAGIEVRVFIKNKPTDTIHIVLMDRSGGAVSSYADVEKEADKICAFFNLINSIN